ncbi:MAG: hypothetical protein IMZ61_11080 [Planctomycetes bacterium]|nr:hypothetical protein [Planctomycetota bacterium]
MNDLVLAKAVPIPEALKIDPRIGPLHMAKSTILPNWLHRVEFTQDGRVPDLALILEEHAPKDGRYVYRAAWIDQHGLGHAYLAWKEQPRDLRISENEKTNDKD